MNSTLIEKRCIVCKMIKPLAEFVMEPVGLGSLSQTKQYGDVCQSCRERLKPKTNIDSNSIKLQPLFVGKKRTDKNDDRGEGGRGKGSRLTLDTKTQLFEINKSKLKMAADQAASRAMAAKRKQTKTAKR